MAAATTPGGPAAAMPESAGSRVAAVFELLEHILLDLAKPCETEWDIDRTMIGLRTLLLSQRTSRMFRGVITNSPEIQKALFFTKPAQNDSTFTINPLLSINTLKDSRTSSLMRTLNVRARLQDKKVGSMEDYCRALCIPVKNLKSKGNKYGSWRKMYVYGGNYPFDVVAILEKAYADRVLFRKTPRENLPLGRIMKEMFEDDSCRIWGETGEDWFPVGEERA